MGEQKEDDQRVEYSATQETVLHYDNFSWQVGAVLVVGVFVFWGLSLSASAATDRVQVIGNLLICLIMSVWLFYTEHNRQIYLFKIHRLHELELDLGMHQHRRFKEWPGERLAYPLDRPVGHHLDTAIYAIISLGGPALALAVEWRWHSLVAVLPFMIGTVWRVHVMDRRTKNIIAERVKAATGKEAARPFVGANTEDLSTEAKPSPTAAGGEHLTGG